MTALVPLNNPNALPRLHEAGVGEIYVGFHDEEWERRFGRAELNRMSGFGRAANPFDFEEMCTQIERARELGMRGFVCFNAASYARQQADFIADAYLGRLREAGCTGVILSSQELIDRARAAGLGVTISTIAGIYNARLAAHYRNRGATRVILPRDLSVDEIGGIMRAVPEVEYEVFMMRNGCMFSDSHCLGCHRAGEPSLCKSLREGRWKVVPVGDAGADFAERAWENERVLNEDYHIRTCGLCALWRFEQFGVDAYKVVGRGDDMEDLCLDAALVMRNAELARGCATEGEFLARMELPRDPETLCGMRGLSCYYPDVSATRVRRAANRRPATR